MACTFSTRETFAVMQWIEADPQRRGRLQERRRQLLKSGIERAIPRMSDAIYSELQQELPKCEGLIAELLKGGLRRVNFLELAHALLQQEEFLKSEMPAAVNDSEQ